MLFFRLFISLLCIAQAISGTDKINACSTQCCGSPDCLCTAAHEGSCAYALCILAAQPNQSVVAPTRMSIYLDQLQRCYLSPRCNVLALNACFQTHTSDCDDGSDGNSVTSILDWNCKPSCRSLMLRCLQHSYCLDNSTASCEQFRKTAACGVETLTCSSLATSLSSETWVELGVLMSLFIVTLTLMLMFIFTKPGTKRLMKHGSEGVVFSPNMKDRRVSVPHAGSLLLRSSSNLEQSMSSITNLNSNINRMMGSPRGGEDRAQQYPTGSLSHGDIDVIFASVTSDVEMGPPGEEGGAPPLPPHVSQAKSTPLIERLPSCKLRWTRGPLVGKGSFGNVHLAIIDDGRIMAVKTVNVDHNTRPEQIDSLLMEVKVMKDLTFEHIVEIHDVDYCAADGTFNILMEFVEGGSLGAIVRRLGQRLPEKTARIYIRQTLVALAYLHSHGIVHRDIKGDNLLLSRTGKVKITDFGCCGQLTDTVIHKAPLVGSPYWMAPEIISQKAHSASADIWSLGCTLSEILNYGKPPWPEFPNVWSAILFLGKTDGIPTELPSVLTAPCRSFMMSCFERDPSLRPSASDLLNHEWFNGME